MRAQRTVNAREGHAQRAVARRSLAARPVLATAAPSSVLAPSDMTTLGKTSVRVPVMGVGAWSWGDRSGYWGYGTEYGKEESRAAYKALMSAGLTFIDTAEVYGFGKSEEFLGEFMREAPPGSPAPVVATKFAPLPWRFTAASVVLGAKASLARLGVPSMGLYMQHWPGYGPQYFCNDAYLEGLAEVANSGLAAAVGVSNFNAERVRGAVRKLGQRGVPLASNQVRGKYSAGGAKPGGPRQLVYGELRLRQVQPVLDAVRAVAEERGKTMAQVSLNWCICKGALPIPGAKNERQLAELAGALGWRLSDAEVAELDAVSGRVPPGQGFPVENW
ncbi:hypothetical protein GPECTOR_22g794 [Gonium pectorale]|uniref:NADP-dependent oxidoreductase domain-containing protein n=1 Tax=Gonium pectorale TaxID=33097 RepID=A0A150GHA2_GONPE|nr:hypothetical protein GPECTOR_22g794 [Gonium pectorale]|eukprot:KXZ49204.1 hypothetical protein GPECTOR_22g794 [Gonium pectorale]